MELYTNSHPILVSDNIVSTYTKLIDNVTKQNTNIFSKIYENYIVPNWGVCIVIVLICVFLLWRYIKYRNRERFNDNNTNTKANATKTQYPTIATGNPFADISMDFNERIARPTFNPSIPVNKQQSYVNYLPDTVPILDDGQFVTNINNMPYTAPNNFNSFQYTGPFYRMGDNGISDEMYNGFVERNKQNLMEYDDLLGDKINIVPS